MSFKIFFNEIDSINDKIKKHSCVLNVAYLSQSVSNHFGGHCMIFNYLEETTPHST